MEEGAVTLVIMQKLAYWVMIVEEGGVRLVIMQKCELIVEEGVLRRVIIKFQHIGN